MKFPDIIIIKNSIQFRPQIQINSRLRFVSRSLDKRKKKKKREETDFLFQKISWCDEHISIISALKSGRRKERGREEVRFHGHDEILHEVKAWQVFRKIGVRKMVSGVFSRSDRNGRAQQRGESTFFRGGGGGWTNLKWRFSGARAIMRATVQSRAITRRASFFPLLPPPPCFSFLSGTFVSASPSSPFLTALPFRFRGRYTSSRNQSVTDARNFVRWWRNREGTSELVTRVLRLFPR